MVWFEIYNVIFEILLLITDICTYSNIALLGLLSPFAMFLIIWVQTVR